MEKLVSVVGGAGHMGLLLCLVLVRHDYKFYGINVNESANRLIMEGKLSFIELGGQEYLKNAPKQGKLVMLQDASKIGPQI
jgi:UDP-N-acetyl-D-mannosaminuronate dehydrogenase